MTGRCRFGPERLRHERRRTATPCDGGGHSSDHCSVREKVCEHRDGEADRMRVKTREKNGPKTGNDVTTAAKKRRRDLGEGKEEE